MTHGRNRLYGYVLVAALTITWTAALNAQDRPPFDVGAVVRETQQHSSDPNRRLFVQWMPVELWAEDPTIAKEQRKQIEEALSEYVLIVVGQAAAVLDPTNPPYTYDELRGLTSLVDNQGRAYASLQDDRLSETAKPLVVALRPRLRQMLSGGGVLQIELLVFPNSDSPNGRTFPRARSVGTYLVRIGPQEFAWSVPLRAMSRTPSP